MLIHLDIVGGFASALTSSAQRMKEGWLGQGHSEVVQEGESGSLVCGLALVYDWPTAGIGLLGEKYSSLRWLMRQGSLKWPDYSLTGP